MTETLYVSVDSSGVEHSPSGDVRWRIESDGSDLVTESSSGLVLREPRALLEVLDQRIFNVVPVGGAKAAPDGTVRVRSARIAEEAPWDTESATRFAIECADHGLGEARDVAFADGSTCGTILEDAREVLARFDSDSATRIGLLARISALRRLSRDRGELAGLSLSLASEDGDKNIDVFDDPAYATLVPVTDAVLAAMEALHHHLLPSGLAALSDRREEREAHAVLDETAAVKVPTPFVTPFGSFEEGGHRVLEYEPAWTSAREAARHARNAARLRNGADGEESERAWQSEKLGEILNR